MQKALFPAAALLLGALVTSCDPCENDDSPPSNTFPFRLESGSSQNLIGNGPELYSPDSLRARLDEQPIELEVATGLFDAGNIVSLWAKPLYARAPQARLLLQVSSTDTDTIDLRFTVRKGSCFDYLEYQTVRFNGENVAPDPISGYYHFIKR